MLACRGVLICIGNATMYKIYYTYILIFVYIYHILISIIVKQYTCLAYRGGRALNSP